MDQGTAESDSMHLALILEMLFPYAKVGAFGGGMSWRRLVELWEEGPLLDHMEI